MGNNQDPGSGINIPDPQRWFLSSRKYYPDVHPYPDLNFLPNPDPGVKKAPDPGSGSATLLNGDILYDDETQC